MKSWLRRWLGVADRADVFALDVKAKLAEVAHGADYRQLRDSVAALERKLDEQTMGSQAAIAEVITELNDLRNRIPASVTQDLKPGVRTVRNWSNFRAAVETPQQPIRIERKS